MKLYYSCLFTETEQEIKQHFFSILSSYSEIPDHVSSSINFLYKEINNYSDLG